MNYPFAVFARIVIALALTSVTAVVSWFFIVSPVIDLFRSVSNALAAALGA